VGEEETDIAVRSLLLSAEMRARATDGHVTRTWCPKNYSDAYSFIVLSN
jgi:hypothetical protein